MRRAWRARSWPVRKWTWAILLGLAWPAAWCFLLAAPPTPGRLHRPPAGPGLVWLPAPAPAAPGAELAAALRNVRSPTLFALPSPVGFSAPFFARQHVLVPPISRAEAPLVAWSFPPFPYQGLDPATRSPGLKEQVAASLPLACGATSPDPRPPLPRTCVVQVDLTGGLAGRRFLAIDLPPGLSDSGLLWEASAEVILTPGDRIRHVLIEKDTHPEFRPAVLAALYRWALTPGPLPAAGKVRLYSRCAPAPGLEAPASAGEGAP